ncbi:MULTISPECIES: hypothetical protein [unclassified Variovorax]|uniref:hypothetical protein n=1 Tax=unclassified Variovorax TaxID=663243 RepID=UPI000B2C4B0C|nr:MULTISPECIES: hypothetical protein [unclassified Variovorax]PNG56015.1 hypothetical protein CHC07_02429 [Variovorax sp. B4]PNG57439.1 hypothetical protein CHC06_02432 [Variovorax sp. B2]VTV10186.1 hypothetical protein WDL1CHR_01198 [Variovorax sp. WDL1]
MAEPRRKSTTHMVLDAVDELHALEQVVTRETLVEHTGLKLAIVDDRIGALIEDGQVHRVRNGVFVPAEKHPPARAISKTVMPDGLVKLEIGDDVLTLTPREDRALAALQAGVAVQFAAINLGHQAAVLNSGINERVLRLERIAARQQEPDEILGTQARADQCAVSKQARSFETVAELGQP